MALDHESKVEHALAREAKSAERIAQQDARDDRGAGRAEAATERDLVVGVEGQARWEGLDAAAA